MLDSPRPRRGWVRTPPGSRVLGAPAIGEDLVPLPTGGRQDDAVPRGWDTSPSARGPWDRPTPSRCARWMPAWSMTALRSSTRSSMVGMRAVRSEAPVPRLSKWRTRANDLGGPASCGVGRRPGSHWSTWTTVISSAGGDQQGDGRRHVYARQPLEQVLYDRRLEVTGWEPPPFLEVGCATGKATVSQHSSATESACRSSAAERYVAPELRHVPSVGSPLAVGASGQDRAVCWRDRGFTGG